MCQVLKLVSHR